MCLDTQTQHHVHAHGHTNGHNHTKPSSSNRPAYTHLNTQTYTTRAHAHIWGLAGVEEPTLLQLFPSTLLTVVIPIHYTPTCTHTHKRTQSHKTVQFEQTCIHAPSHTNINKSIYIHAYTHVSICVCIHAHVPSIPRSALHTKTLGLAYQNP